MNIQSLKMPRTSLVLVWVAYVLLGWHLSAYHIVWLVGVFVAIFTIAIVWKTEPLLGRLLTLFRSQSLVIVISLSLAFSVGVTLLATEPVVMPLFSAPTITMLLAALDLYSAGVRQLDVLISLLVAAGIGLGLGECVDFFLLPSMRY